MSNSRLLVRESSATVDVSFVGFLQLKVNPYVKVSLSTLLYIIEVWLQLVVEKFVVFGRSCTKEGFMNYDIYRATSHTVKYTDS